VACIAKEAQFFSPGLNCNAKDSLSRKAKFEATGNIIDHFARPLSNDGHLINHEDE
jgi:hypothetical protein